MYTMVISIIGVIVSEKMEDMEGPDGVVFVSVSRWIVYYWVTISV